MRLGGLSADRTRKNKHPFIHKILHVKRCGEYCRDALRGIGSPDGKLRTYALFKRDSGSEKYLHEIKNAALRQSLTKFKLSNNVLNIEKGRLGRTIIPLFSSFKLLIFFLCRNDLNNA